MNFGEAFEAVKQGKSMRLPAWTLDMTVKAQYPDACSKMTEPYLYVDSCYGRVPWQPTEVELFSEDWVVI
jgi:hypothetical protein